MTETEVLVLGAGPAGISAAIAAAEHGCRTLLLDDNPFAGGQIWRASGEQPSHQKDARRAAAWQRLAASGVQLQMGWQVFDAPGVGTLRAIAGGTVETFRYRSLVLATGARERFLPFPGWTLPGVFGAGGLQALVQGGFPVEGKRIVVAGSGPLLLAVAAHLRRYRARIVSVAEQAPLRQLARFLPTLLRHPARLWQAMRYRWRLGSAPYRSGCWPLAALGAERVTGIRLTNGREIWEEACDLIACGFHLVPNTELASLLGCTFRGAFVAVDDHQQTSMPGVYCAGEITGIAGLVSALLQGRVAGLACAGQHSKADALRRKQRSSARFATSLERVFALREPLRRLAQPDTIVCRCEDVAYGALVPCRSWTEGKLQTRCGMGPCQGRVCGPATQTLFGWTPGSIRPPIYPVPVSAFMLDETDEPNPVLHQETQ